MAGSNGRRGWHLRPGRRETIVAVASYLQPVVSPAPSQGDEVPVSRLYSAETAVEGAVLRSALDPSALARFWQRTKMGNSLHLQAVDSAALSSDDWASLIRGDSGEIRHGVATASSCRRRFATTARQHIRKGLKLAADQKCPFVASQRRPVAPEMQQDSPNS